MTTAAKKTKTNPNKKDSTATQQVGIRELRQSASQILAKVKDGAIFEITDHGVPVAKIVPIVRSLYEDYIAAGLIIAAENSDWHPTTKPGKVKGSKSSTQVLMGLRAEERY